LDKKRLWIQKPAMRLKTICLWGYLLALCLSLELRGDVLVGKVVRVADGDAFTLLEGQTQRKVRLQGIDAPELGQPFGQKARKALSSMIFGKTVHVKTEEMDRYQRVLGQVYLKGAWINLQLVEQGLAWHYLSYSKDKDLARAEEVARSKERGLWVDDGAVSPWLWRQGKRIPMASSSHLGHAGDNKSDSLFFYRTTHGKRFHLAGCRYLRNEAIELTMLAARESGLMACRVCQPNSSQ
jgi:micrococcal nuclease